MSACPATTMIALHDVLMEYRVAVEIGSGNQTESMRFAMDKAHADVIIGIDPEYEFSSIPNNGFDKFQRPVTIILIRGDAWGDRRINDNLFKAFSENKADKLAIYSQIVAPDSVHIESMTTATIPLSKDGFFVVIDSGGIDYMNKQSLGNHDIKVRLMKEDGIQQEGYTELDWITNLYNKFIRWVSYEDYAEGMNNGTYPWTGCLRAGQTLIIEKPMSI